jgi:hypothetical protein
MVRRLLLLAVAVSFVVGFTLPAFAGGPIIVPPSPGHEKPKFAIWKVECDCKWFLELEYSHNWKKEEVRAFCSDHKPVFKFIKAPDEGKKIELDAKLFDRKWEADTESAEKKYDGSFYVDHRVDDCKFSSTVKTIGKDEEPDGEYPDEDDDEDKY